MLDFNVPDGFEEVVRNTTTKYNKTVDNIAYFSEIKNYKKDNDTLSLSVSKNPSHKATDDTARHYGGNSETINGVAGYLKYHPQNVTRFISGNYIYTITTYPYYTFALIHTILLHMQKMINWLLFQHLKKNLYLMQ